MTAPRLLVETPGGNLVKARLDHVVVWLHEQEAVNYEAVRELLKEDLSGHCTYHGSRDPKCCTSWRPDVYYRWFGPDDIERVINAALTPTNQKEGKES